jgi:hypothetical protein
MKCQMCDAEFFSTEWFKDDKLLKLKFVCCDGCLLYILNTRMDFLKSKQNSLNRKINELKLKIDNEQ